MKIDNLVNEFVLGTLLADDLPLLSKELLQSGCDSPSLYELADSRGLDSEYLRKLFINAVEELGLTLPSEEVAALSSARNIAKDVVEERIAPYHGARRIWTELYTRFPNLELLRPFVGMASEYEDDELHRTEYNQMIVDECKTLLAKEDNGDTA